MKSACLALIASVQVCLAVLLSFWWLKVPGPVAYVSFDPFYCAHVWHERGNLVMYGFRPKPGTEWECDPSARGRILVNLRPMKGVVFTSVDRIEVPLWLLIVLLFVHPTALLVRGPLRRQRCRRRGLCVKCGYNLTGNTSSVCPECGAAI